MARAGSKKRREGWFSFREVQNILFRFWRDPSWCFVWLKKKEKAICLAPRYRGPRARGFVLVLVE